VLDTIDLTIAKGEFVSIIGPSGCGKSTVLKLISGLAMPSAGTIRVDGIHPGTRANGRIHFPGRHPSSWRTVRQNVGLGLELEGINGNRRQQNDRRPA